MLLILYIILLYAKLTYAVVHENQEKVCGLSVEEALSIQDVMLKWVKGPALPHWKNHITERGAELYLPLLTEPGTCQTHSQYTLAHALKGDTWALSMLDSSSRPGPGLLEGRIQDMGNYDQCLRVKEPTGQFTGLHCEVNLRGVLPPELEQFYGRSSFGMSFPAGHILFLMCVPSTCSSDDILTHVTRAVAAANITLPPEALIETSCNDLYYNNVSWKKPVTARIKDIIVMGIFVTIVGLVLIGTFCEWKKPTSKSGLLCFSVISNWRGLTVCSADDLPCLHGLRVVFALSVLVTHRILLSYHMPILNFPTLLEQKQSLLFAVLANGSLATEGFFLINGVTRSYAFFKDRFHNKPVNHFYSCIRRYFRVTPAMCAIIIYSCTLAVHISDGPVHSKGLIFEDLVCSCLWPLNVFHISNFLVVYRCRSETWFIAADYQLFLLSPLILLPLYRSPRKGILLLISLFVLSTSAKVIYSFVYLLYADVATLQGEFPGRKMSLAHFNTCFRASSFFLGIVVGLLLFNLRYHNKRKSMHLNKWLAGLGWLLSIAVLIATPILNSINLDPEYEDNPLFSAFFVGLWEQVFAAAIGWVVFACSSGHGGLLNKLLSHQVLQPFAKLSFSFYLTHMSFQSIHIFRSRQPIQFDNFNLIHLCLADTVVTLGLATLLYLLVESPCYRAANLLLDNYLKHNANKSKKKSG